MNRRFFSFSLAAILWCAVALFLLMVDISPATFAAESFPELADKVADVLPEPPDGFRWELVWHDEFDGNEVDRSRWDSPNYQRKGGWWSEKSFALDGEGNLKMMVFQDADGKFTDGCLRTRGTYEKAKGYFVARMKMHKQVGHWSAFWLMNGCEGSVGNGSADGAEIDIMEKPWLDDRVNFAIHWDGYGAEHRSCVHVARIPDVMDGFHTFSLWWSDDFYRFYIDGRQEWETTADGICTEPLYLKLSDEIGTWAGDINQATLPDETLIDYVRVYDLVPIQHEN